MKLIDAELVNFCQYKHKHVTFAPGLTAIIGRNGSGKSNLVKAVYAAVTGDFGRNDGVKTDNICQFADKSAPSRIRVSIEHGPATMDITRGLRPHHTQLRIKASGAQEQKITKAQEATDEIATILGVSPRMLADYVFVDQWSIFNFLSMMPAERAKAFQRLFRTERAEALWKIIGDEHDDIVIPTPGIDRDAAVVRLNEHTTTLVRLQQDLHALTDLASLYSVNDLRQKVIDYKLKTTLQNDIQQLERKIGTLAADIATMADRLAELTKDDTALTEFVTSERDAYMHAKHALNNIAAHTQMERKRQQLLARRAELKRTAETLHEPVPPAGGMSLADLANNKHTIHIEHQKAKQEVWQLTTHINAIARGTGICDSCGSHINSTTEHAQALKSKLAEAQAAYTAADNVLTTSRTYHTHHQQYTLARDNAVRQIADIDEQLDTMVTISAPDKSQNELTAFIAQYDDMQAAQRETNTALNTIKQQHHGKVSVYAQLQQDLATKQASFNGFIVTADAAADAQQQLAAAADCTTKLAVTRANIAATTRLVTDDEKTIADLDRLAQEAAQSRAWASYLLDIRHILHRDNLPHVVAQNYLELMQDEINALLTRFSSTFTVRADESLSFVATFHDGRSVPASRLSGGEKVLLALAFRVAVNDIFAKDLGLLVLDEPTAGLDSGNLSCLRVAIQRLKELSSARGLQVIMITHEHDLHNLFDHVIEVS